MRRHVLFFVGLALTIGVRVSAAAGQDAGQVPGQVQVVEETEIDRQVRELASELRCPVCQGLSLQDSPSELAQEMRDVIRTQLEAGETQEEVRQYFVGSYGEWILLEPTAQGFNLTVYLLPVLAVVVGAVLLLIVGRRWLAGEATGAPGTTIEEDDPDLASWEEIASR